MSKVPLSEHCSLMARPGGPPKPKVRPADCPEGAAYIKLTDAGGEYGLRNIAPFPIVVEGGAGKDQVTVIGHQGNPVLIDGGDGDDSVTIDGRDTKLGGDPSRVFSAKGEIEYIIATDVPALPANTANVLAAFANRPTIDGTFILVAMAIAFTTMAVLGWRALSGSRGKNK